MAADLGGPRALPVAAEVDRWSASHRQSDHAVDLLAVADAKVFAPSRLLRVTNKRWTGDVAVMAELAATQAGEVGLSTIGAGAVNAVAVLMKAAQAF